jgi:hypothetical protein
MTQRFTLNESRLPELADPELGDRFPVVTDHDVLMLLEAVLPGTSDSPLIDGPCEMAIDLLADEDGLIDGWRVIIRPDEEHTDAPWLSSHINRVSYLEPLPEPTENDGRYDPAAIIRDAVALANELLDWYERTALTGPELAALRELLAYNRDKEQADWQEQDDDTDLDTQAFGSVLLLDQAVRRLQGIECCGRRLPHPRPGQETRCGGCGSVYTTVLEPGWREWISPADVSHIIPPTGPCATCGRGRHDDQETAP